MKKTFLGVGLVLSFLCLLASCGSAVNDNNNDNGPSKPDTTEEKVKLYKSLIGEYTNYDEDLTYEIAEDKIVIEWTSLNYFDFEKDLYYYDELPEDNFFKSSYICVDAEPGRIMHEARLGDKEDTDTVSLKEWLKHYYCEVSDLYSNRYYDYEKDVLYEKQYLVKKYEPSETNNVLYLYKSNYQYLIGLHYNSDHKLTKISKYQLRLGAVASVWEISDFKTDRVIVNDNGEFQIIDIENDDDFDLLVKESLSEEIENSGLDYEDWKKNNQSKYIDKYGKLSHNLRAKETSEWDSFYCSIYDIKEYSVLKKSSGNDNDDNGNEGGDDSESIDPSEFEGYTWKYSHQNVSSTTTQNVVFKNGTVTVTTITKSNNSSTTNKNREETASYELDGDKITITYSKYGYDTTAEFTISVDGNTLTLESDDDDYDAISLLGTLFQNSDGTSKMSFTLSDEGSASDSDDDEDDSNSTIKASDIENITWKYQYEYNNWYFEFKNGKVTQRHVIQGSYMGGLEGTYKLKGDKLTVTYQSRYDGSDITGTVRLSFTDYGLKLDAEGDTNAGYVVNGFFEGSDGKQYLNKY